MEQWAYNLLLAAFVLLLLVQYHDIYEVAIDFQAEGALRVFK